jgi:hypothetical protein
VYVYVEVTNLLAKRRDILIAATFEESLRTARRTEEILGGFRIEAGQFRSRGR